MVDHSNFSATSGLLSAKAVGQRSCPIGKHLGLRDLPFRSNQGRWSPTAKCSYGLRAPALLPERLALDSLEGATLDLALALANQRGCGRGLDGGGLRCRGLRCRLGYRPLLQSDDFRFGHTL
jgi:hypothetical protein